VKKRQFFTEGTELFNKADLLFTENRCTTKSLWTATDSLHTNEKVADNPIAGQTGKRK